MRITFWQLALLATTQLVFASTSLSAEPQPESPEQQVLDQWVGEWRAAYKLPMAEWSPQETSGTAEITTSPVLGGRYVRERLEHSDKTSGMRMLTYDPQKKCYRGWWFSSARQSVEFTGKWDDDSKTMTWNSVEEAGIRTAATNRFVDDDHVEWDVTITNPAGKVLFRMDGTSVRDQKPKG